jgi:hypothetical protein
VTSLKAEGDLLGEHPKVIVMNHVIISNVNEVWREYIYIYLGRCGCNCITGMFDVVFLSPGDKGS